MPHNLSSSITTPYSSLAQQPETQAQSLESFRLPSDQDASGRTLGDDEAHNLAQVLASGVLTSTKGTFVKQLEQNFAELLGIEHAYACTSGTAAIHTAIAALNPNPGDEIISSAITDMGALAPILYQGAIPVFADVDPRTGNLSADTIAAQLNERTKAIIVTHLFGNPCDMDPILSLARKHAIPIIEDCAQAFLAQSAERFVGTRGTIGCFSLQQGKHITTGEGGLVVTQDQALARRMCLFINKGWDYSHNQHNRNEQPDHSFLALNYRMSELQGAVAVAQLSKLAAVVQRRRATAEAFTQQLQTLQKRNATSGLHTPYVYPTNIHTYWKYSLRIDDQHIPGGAVALGRLLADKGIPSAPRYIQKPAFQCGIFQNQETFGTSRYPFTLARPAALQYDPANFPGTFTTLAQLLVLPWNEGYTEQHLSYLIHAIDSAIIDLQLRVQQEASQ